MAWAEIKQNAAKWDVTVFFYIYVLTVKLMLQSNWKHQQKRNPYVMSHMPAVLGVI